jgi:hypothetical protein
MRQITVRIEDDLFSRIEALSSDADRSVNYMISKLLDQAVRERERKKNRKNSTNSTNFAQGEE